jgi:hypothetical protein
VPDRQVLLHKLVQYLFLYGLRDGTLRGLDMGWDTPFCDGKDALLAK